MTFYTASKTFGNFKVTFDVCSNIVEFSINGNYDYIENNPHRVAMSKWLLKEFIKAKKQHTYLLCLVHNDDKQAKYRKEIYKKLGFVKTHHKKLLMWNPNKVDIQGAYNKHKWIQLALITTISLIGISIVFNTYTITRHSNSCCTINNK